MKRFEITGNTQHFGFVAGAPGNLVGRFGEKLDGRCEQHAPLVGQILFL